MAEKLKFKFPGNPPAEPQYRIANALEYIAHYLDRIDDRLERLATVVNANGEGFPMLKAELAAIRESLQDRKQ